VTFSPLVSESEENSAITHAGATDVSSIPALRMRAVNASDAALAALQANSAVTHVEADKVRDVQATPSDPGYTSQWSLSKIGWDNVFGSVYPSGSSTVAVLDTGVDASTPDLADQLVSGTSIVDPNSDGTTDPNGHGTEMAGIVAAATDIGLLLKASEENREQMA
jgi:subtilisin family serine protease